MSAVRFKAVFTACLFLLAAAPSGVAALTTARVVLPAELAVDSESLQIVGFGGRNRGDYRLGPLGGSFTRIETRWAVFDPLYAANRAQGSFTLSGPGVDGAISGSCGMRKNSITIGVVTFDTKRMSYQCTFERDGKIVDARFALGHPRPDGAKQRLLAWDRRAGATDFGGVQLALRSVHDLVGTKLASPVPVGYWIESEGAVVGAVELTDVNPTFYLRRDLPPALREPVLVAAMALAVLRDPADSALGD